MKMMRKSWILLVLILFSTPILSGQTLSGTSLVSLSTQIGQDQHQVSLVHQSPAVIQQLTYWLIEASPYSAREAGMRRLRLRLSNL
jgi:negative regulator of sigma E activity